MSLISGLPWPVRISLIKLICHSQYTYPFFTSITNKFNDYFASKLKSARHFVIWLLLFLKQNIWI